MGGRRENRNLYQYFFEKKHFYPINFKIIIIKFIKFWWDLVSYMFLFFITLNNCFDVERMKIELHHASAKWPSQSRWFPTPPRCATNFLVWAGWAANVDIWCWHDQWHGSCIMWHVSNTTTSMGTWTWMTRIGGNGWCGQLDKVVERVHVRRDIWCTGQHDGHVAVRDGKRRHRTCGVP